MPPASPIQLGDQFRAHQESKNTRGVNKSSRGGGRGGRGKGGGESPARKSPRLLEKTQSVLNSPDNTLQNSLRVSGSIMIIYINL